MMRSLYSAVSGLKAHQTRMDVIGNNIANVNTVAYKSQSMTFSEVFYQTTQTASGPNAESGKGGTNAMQIGLGSSVGSISTAISSEGASERTDNPWDVMISGKSFFIVNSAGNTYFTRAGNFKVDESGALVTSAGANVQGWQVDENGAIVKDRVSNLYVKSPKFTYTMPQVTTAVSAAGNVNASSKEDVTTTLNFYDSLGNSYQATVTLKYEGTTGDTTTYTMAGNSISKNGEATDLQISMDDPQRISFNSLTGASLADNSNLTLSIKDMSDDGKWNIESIGTNAGDTSTLRFDASGLTMIADKTAITSDYGIKNPTTGVMEGAGKAVGKMTAVGIDNSGCIVASYSNGDTKTIGQIAVTSFSNPEGLEKVGENLYSATLNSGEFDGIGEDVTATDGKITSGVLEMSNVDLSSEFTTMITTQRGYQANSRIITVSDSMLEELINLKR
ncbi:MAG: flagellar hook protein FlgE [Eubacteriales bacterium]|nr:flagellar hook protein FlgE [Eubacteriales bacterium]